MPTNYYDVLGVRPEASQTEIHDAYVAALEEFRPASGEDRRASERLATVRIAYNALKRPASRRAYNARLGLAQPPERRWKPDPLPDLLEGHTNRWRSPYFVRARGFGLIALLVALAFAIIRHLTE
jgi:curved DNA-binding protein CbpA